MSAERAFWLLASKQASTQKCIPSFSSSNSFGKEQDAVKSIIPNALYEHG